MLKISTECINGCIYALKEVKVMSNTKIIWLAMFLPLVVTLVILLTSSFDLSLEYRLLFVGEYSRQLNIFVLPVLVIILGCIMQIFVNKSSEQNKKIIFYSSILVLLLINIVTYIYLYKAYEVFTEVESKMSEDIVVKIVLILISIIIIIIGSFLPNTKPNHVLGIRTKWALEDEGVWEKTHFLARKVMIIFGTINFILSFFATESNEVLIYLFFVMFFIPLLIPAVYSYTIRVKSN